jgi:hypothetical protein
MQEINTFRDLPHRRWLFDADDATACDFALGVPPMGLRVVGPLEKDRSIRRSFAEPRLMVGDDLTSFNGLFEFLLRFEIPIRIHGCAIPFAKRLNFLYERFWALNGLLN